jgi:hypothetical protein
MKTWLLRASTLLPLVLLIASATRADVTYNVTLDTSGLTMSPDNSQGAFFVDFSLVPGAAGNDNTATISNFSFGGGQGMDGTNATTDTRDSQSGWISAGVSPTGVDLLTSGLTLTDNPNGTEADFDEQFTPGSAISFTLYLTTNGPYPPTTPAPDAFIFQVWSNVTVPPGTPLSLENAATTTMSTSPYPSYLELDITGSTPTVPPIGSLMTVDTSGDSRGMLNNGDFTPAPQFGPLGAVPEPSTLSLMAFGLVGLAAGGRWRRKAAAT